MPSGEIQRDKTTVNGIVYTRDMQASQTHSKLQWLLVNETGVNIYYLCIL